MKAAFGKVVITPPPSFGKVEMAGYSPRAKTIAGIADDIHARAILIEDEVFTGIKRSFLMISLDFPKIPMKIVDYIKDEIKDKADFGLGPGQILVHAIHTHKAPDLTGEFYWNGGILSTIRGVS